jgi:hypothetical protein
LLPLKGQSARATTDANDESDLGDFQAYRPGVRERLPTIYPYRYFVTSGELISYGIDLWRRSASYVDRILKGEKPADLPVQAPTKYEMAINLKTAKALGIAVPPTLWLAPQTLMTQSGRSSTVTPWCLWSRQPRQMPPVRDCLT